MRILIVESDFYLAKGVSNKLEAAGFVCEIVLNSNLVLHPDDFEVALVSTQNLPLEVVRKLVSGGTSVILMSEFINANTIFDFMDAGASDYIQKPIIISELVRKIHQILELNSLRRLKDAYEALLSRAFEHFEIGTSFNYKKIKLPLLVMSESREFCDNFVYNIVKQNGFDCIDTGSNNKNLRQIIKTLKPKTLLYITNFCNIPVSDFSFLEDITHKHKVVLGSNHNIEKFSHPKIRLGGKKEFASEKFLSIKDYVRAAILTFQDSMSESELARSLGISRKSLWQKRKEFGIER